MSIDNPKPEVIQLPRGGTTEGIEEPPMDFTEKGIARRNSGGSDERRKLDEQQGEEE